MHDDFGVAPGPKTMAPAFQLPREGGESVDLPVERDPDGPVLIRERLRAVSDIDDREAGIHEEDVLGGTDVVAAAVRSAVAQGGDHPADGCRDLFPLERELTRDSAHRYPPIRIPAPRDPPAGSTTWTLIPEKEPGDGPNAAGNGANYCWAKYACASPRKCCSGSDSRSYASPTRGASSSASRGRLGRIA